MEWSTANISSSSTSHNQVFSTAISTPLAHSLVNLLSGSSHPLKLVLRSFAMSAPARRAVPPPPEDEVVEGASPNEQILSAAKEDNEELFLEAIEQEHDINHQDGLGNTALHYAIIYASTTVLDHILEHDQCDVDLQNKLQRDTPLHLAVKIEENGREGLREYLVQQLVDAGASPMIRDRHSLRPIDLLPPPPPGRTDNSEVRALLRRAEAELQLGGGAGKNSDVADDDDLIDEGDIASDDD
ncbi:hypothetical protein HD553DRAFT_310039 [Filobasidium floriforme]|uniref:uncharacterized protein n=1 Tax=Filobasidium floriforme TaxID=5210 RepID=UPI001E8D4CAC|nr:uncharacterized protein HD553DRAFT_310039 [Filobasidium floriforme]KAH8085686.1 hypothetical protein HD553DRAFT_310039 [Filobasidium floriforme]